MSASVDSQFAQQIRQYSESLRTRADIERFVSGFTEQQLNKLLFDWEAHALPHQRMPTGKWRRWVLRGGRGSGKSYAANNTLHTVARNKRTMVGRGVLAIVGRTHDDVRTNNILDPETGLLATAPPDFKPTWRPGPGIIEWPNGVICYALSGDAPGSIRGKNISFLVADELPEWPNSEETWFEVLEPAVRKGIAKIMICMTPKPLPWLRTLEGEGDTVVTGASTYSNPFLAKSALASFEKAYANKAVGKQELYGEYIEQVQGSLLTYSTIVGARTTRAPHGYKQIIVAVDPAVTSGAESDETGVIVYGLGNDDVGYVLADESGKFEISTGAWARHVVDVYHKWNANKVIAEVNNGGDFVEAGLRAIDSSIPYAKVRASHGKRVRAEPVAVLYEQGKIKHLGATSPVPRYVKLEEEWTTWIPGTGKSPNRLDAVVWAATYVHLTGEAPASSSNPVDRLSGLVGRRR